MSLGPSSNPRWRTHLESCRDPEQTLTKPFPSEDQRSRKYNNSIKGGGLKNGSEWKPKFISITHKVHAITSLFLPRDELKHRRIMEYDGHCLKILRQREILFLQLLQVVSKCVFAERYDDIGRTPERSTFMIYEILRPSTP